MPKEADILEFEGAVKDYMEQVAKGEQITILRDGVPMATLKPVQHSERKNRVAGREKGNIQILGDLDEPCIPLEHWNMLKD